MKVARDIEQTVIKEAKDLDALSEAVFAAKPGGKWSAKEIVGHLIDSAQNNIQRFVRGQYEDTPKIIYAQDDWVKLQAYQQADKKELIQLWVLINKHLCRVLTTMDPANYQRKSDWGHTAPDIQTLEFIAQDYHRHMIHHLDQLKERILTLK